MPPGMPRPRRPPTRRPSRPAVDATVALLTTLPVAAASLVAPASCATAMLRRTLRVACIFRWTATGSAAAARLAFRYPFSERSPRGASLAVASVPARRRRTLRPMMTALLALKAMSSAPSSSVSLSALLLAVPMATLATWARSAWQAMPSGFCGTVTVTRRREHPCPFRPFCQVPRHLPGGRCRMTSGESPTALPRRFPA